MKPLQEARRSERALSWTHKNDVIPADRAEMGRLSIPLPSTALLVSGTRRIDVQRGKSANAFEATGVLTTSCSAIALMSGNIMPSLDDLDLRMVRRFDRPVLEMMHAFKAEVVSFDRFDATLCDSTRSSWRDRMRSGFDDQSQAGDQRHTLFGLYDDHANA